MRSSCATKNWSLASNTVNRIFFFVFILFMNIPRHLVQVLWLFHKHLDKQKSILDFDWSTSGSPVSPVMWSIGDKNSTGLCYMMEVLTYFLQKSYNICLPFLIVVRHTFTWSVFLNLLSKASNITRQSSCTSCCCHASSLKDNINEWVVKTNFLRPGKDYCKAVLSLITICYTWGTYENLVTFSLLAIKI